MLVKIVYEAYEDNVWVINDHIAMLAEKCRGYLAESGTGFGQRDVDYAFKAHAHAKLFMKELSKYDFGVALQWRCFDLYEAPAFIKLSRRPEDPNPMLAFSA